MDIIKKIENTKVDWNDFESASEITTELLNELCSAQQNIESLIDYMLRSKRLRGMCESNSLLDVLVLYDSLEDQGIRIRMHIAKKSQLHRPHDHRWSFTTKILSGGYDHAVYKTNTSPYEITDLSNSVDYQSPVCPDPNYLLGNKNFELVLKHRMQPGATMTICHSNVHTVEMKEGACSIIIRGPAAKERSLIYDFDNEKLWWRFGANNETEKRQNEKKMSSEHLKLVIQNVRESLCNVPPNQESF
ncbi:hypothetical protein AB6D60_22475 [Vibrio splendidus]